MLRSSLLKRFGPSFSLCPSFPFSKYYGDKLNYELNVNKLRANEPLLSYIDAFRKYGHNFAAMDPLNISKNENSFPSPSQFNLNTPNSSETTKKLEFLYTGTVGVEFDHVSDLTERKWLYENYEKAMMRDVSKSEILNIHNLLVFTETLDHFLHKKFSTFKRYALEGNESMIIALRTLFSYASQHSVEEIVLGMPHRGRLNVLVNLLDYPVRDLFRKIMGKCDIPEEFYTKTDDVVSHVACSNRKVFLTGSGKPREVQVSLLHNPSHLEAVNPVSLGKTKAKQDDLGSQEKVLNVQLHGDAAHAGQGIIYESLAIGKMPKYSVGGSIHVIVNNQIGYTTTPSDGRGSKYSSDICKTFEIPILHINSEDVESLHKLCEFAIEYRSKFKKDFMIDLIGYRRYGHNEVDEPSFTQPIMYDKIRNQQVTFPKKYHELLVSKGIVKNDELVNLVKKANTYLESEFQAIGAIRPPFNDPLYKGNRAFTHKWVGMTLSTKGKRELTGINVDLAKELCKKTVQVPQAFQMHDRLAKFWAQERLMGVEKEVFDWPTAEAMALLSVAMEGNNIRLSGQDVERGTFSQRHFVLVDQKTEQKITPILECLKESGDKGRFQVSNSLLSEYGVMAYEYGYAIESPKNLVIWEAQFGDFFNGAQIVIDTFITSSEVKWLRQNGLILLLPHGFDGAGPEHSTFRMERFLQLAATDGGYKGYQKKQEGPLIKGEPSFLEDEKSVNFHLVIPTTPANVFHMYRRQISGNYRKPLVVGSAKTLLRHPKAKSTFAEISPGTSFQPILSNALSPLKTTVFLCTGKITYEIQSLLEKNDSFAKKVGLITIEELLPFPEERLQNLLKENNLGQNCKFVWVQEEPLNSGGFSYVEPRIQRVMDNLGCEGELIYCGRRSLGCPAIGWTDGHKEENKELMEKIIELGLKD